MKYIISIAFILALAACANEENEKEGMATVIEEQSPEKNEIFRDTISSSFPVQIGNDKGLVQIVGERTFINKQLADSDFLVSLDEIQGFSISKYIDKEILIDSNKTVLLKDSINVDYLNGAIIKEVEFEFVRSNTLYFKVLFENPIDHKEIKGRFNLFYRTKKKGLVYGWITDEVNELASRH